MGFTEDYESAAQDLEEYFAGTLVYEDPDTESTTLAATIHPERRERRKNAEGGFDWVTTRKVILFDHTDPTVTPRRDAKITIDSEAYAILDMSTPSAGRRELKLQRSAAAEIARRKYRGTR